MGSLKEIFITKHGLHYSDGKINIKDFDLDKVLVRERPRVCFFDYPE